MPEMTTGPNVSWLDEELRRARAIVDDLRDVTDKQQVRMVDQEQRIMALEDRLAKVHAELLKLPEAQEAAQRTRDEIVLRLSEMRQDTQKRETESLRARQIEREQDSKALQTLVVQLDRLGPLEQGIAMRRPSSSVSMRPYCACNRTSSGATSCFRRLKSLAGSCRMGSTSCWSNSGRRQASWRSCARGSNRSATAWCR